MLAIIIVIITGDCHSELMFWVHSHSSQQETVVRQPLRHQCLIRGHHLFADSGNASKNKTDAPQWKKEQNFRQNKGLFRRISGRRSTGNGFINQDFSIFFFFKIICFRRRTEEASVDFIKRKKRLNRTNILWSSEDSLLFSNYYFLSMFILHVDPKPTHR